MRGGAIVILASLVGAWALGLAEAGSNEEPPPPNVVKPIEPDDSPNYDIKGSSIVEKSDAPRTRNADPSEDADVEPIVDTGDETTDEVDGDPADPTPDSPDPTPDSPDPTPDSPDPTTPPPPTDPPGQPEEECTDLVSVLNCVLDPITSQP